VHSPSFSSDKRLTAEQLRAALSEIPGDTPVQVVWEPTEGAPQRGWILFASEAHTDIDGREWPFHLMAFEESYFPDR
jgi:hypothetical protein